MKKFPNQNCSEDMFINAQFPVQGKKLPAGHGYLLYSAISQAIPSLHEIGWLGIEQINGVPFDKGIIALPHRGAKLSLRIPADKFGKVIPLAGKQLAIDEYKIRIGIPIARPIVSAPMLYSRIVTIRGFTEISKFLEAAKKQIKELNIKAELELPAENMSRHRHATTIKNYRRIITIKGKKIVGFSLVARGLNDKDSLKLQNRGIGGRRSMGCGIFNPIRKPYDLEGDEDE